MAVPKNDIRRWFKEGKHWATHMIVARDIFDHNEYPIYVSANEDVRKKKDEIDRRPIEVMGVYSLSMDMDTQLNEHSAFNYE